MLKFMKHQHKLTPERIQKQKELFAFTKGCHHGFPAKPSALAWDPKLRLLALATKNAEIRVYGAPGIEFYGIHENAEVAVTHLTFLPGTCNLVSLCEDNSLHLWKICAAKGDTMQLVQEKTTSLEGKLKKISVIVPDAACENLLVGTEGGNIYLLNLNTFQMSDNIIYQDVVMQNVPEDYKVNPGPVEAIAEHPLEAEKILIGYQRGLIVLWDKKNLQADQTYVCSQQLESMCWIPDGTEFTSSHNDGSYMTWSTSDSATPKDGPHTVYGPFPCKPINKILRPQSKDGDLIVFGGGMPRASYGDRNTVTAIQDEEHVTFNLTSKVIDFVVVEETETGGASCLVILAEEEIVFLDLATSGWPAFSAPYLASLHTSAITCSTFVSAMAQDVFDKLKSAGDKQACEVPSRSWPINGGTPTNTNNSIDSKGNSQKDMLLTGHEDGTVRFWDASGISLILVYKMSTAALFVSEDLGGDGAAAEDDDWPPFRKAGLFDPYSDDPRLGIKKMEMCAFTGTLIVAGTAGQIMVLNLVMEEKEMVTQLVDVNLVAENDNFVWKSHSKLDMIKEAVKFDVGMQPNVVIQFYPPASCTSLTLNSEWGLVACGTAHGFALFDFIQKKNLLAKSTLSALDLANAADEGPMSRRKSLKKSLRESFRRLRRGRSQRKTSKPGATSPASQTGKSSGVGAGAAVGAGEDETIRPLERAIESRTHASDYIGSMVRCLHLTKCFIATNQVMSATLWAGTNSGTIYVFTIAIPPHEKRSETPLAVQLGKEIHLKHGAPVISVHILDGLSRPFPVPMAVKKEASPPPDTTSPHRVLICSEEQFKVFTLPQLKPFCKFKLTAHEGSRVRKIGLSTFNSTADSKYSEPAFLVVTNQGDFSAYSLPECRRQLHTMLIKKEDINGINSCVFSNRGEALYSVSPCELQRVSFSAQHITQPYGSLPPPDPPKSSITTAIINNTEEDDSKEEKKNNNEVVSEDDGAMAVDAAEESDDKPLSPSLKTENAEKDSKVSNEAICTKKEEIRENGDNSVLSGDITIDSIRDHMDELKINEKTAVESVSSCGSTTVATNSNSSTTIAATADSNSTTTVAAVSSNDCCTPDDTTGGDSVSSNSKQESSSSSVTVVKSTTITSVSSQAGSQ